jgi:type I restriction enzyme S subunit
MPNISKARLRSFPIALPPIADQQAFAACVARIEAQRVTIQRALAADDELFASLQSRAFSGKL